MIVYALEGKTMMAKVTSVTISSRRNDWGWYTIDGWIQEIDGHEYLHGMRTDSKPRTKKAAKELLLKSWEGMSR